MLALLIIFTCVSGFAAQNKIERCQVERVFYSNYFEESLSVSEYPNFSISKIGNNYIVSVGSYADFETKNGDSITATAYVNGEMLYLFNYKDQTDKFQFTTHKVQYYNEESSDYVKEKLGVLLVQEDSDNQNFWLPVASFKCK